MEKLGQALKTFGYFKAFLSFAFSIGMAAWGATSDMRPISIVLTALVCLTCATAIFTIIAWWQSVDAALPFVIFDQDKSILVDGQGMKLLNSINIENEGATNLPRKITVSMKNHTAHAPLISCLDPAFFAITAVRGEKHDWIFNLEVIYYQTGKQPPMRFRLEIIQ